MRLSAADPATAIHAHLVLVIPSVAVEIEAIKGEGHDNKTSEAVSDIPDMGQHVDDLGIFIFEKSPYPTTKMHVVNIGVIGEGVGVT